MFNSPGDDITLVRGVGMNLVNCLDKLPQSLVTVLALLLCVAVGVVDGILGHVYSLDHSISPRLSLLPGS